MSSFLLQPCNNTLSHIAKCLALREELERRGQKVWLAVSSRRRGFLQALGLDRGIVSLPDIQEADGAAGPNLSWFRPERIKMVLSAELALLHELRPDRVLGVFRFTGPLSAHLAGIPYDSLICGSMTPACTEVPGFAEGEEGADAQRNAMQFFRTATARRMAPALQQAGLEPVQDVWQLLQGERTFLWDFPEFQPLPSHAGYLHIGPPFWSGWPRADSARLDRLRGPVAYVAFGTGCVQASVLHRLIETLWIMGYAIALAMGGQPALTISATPERLAMFDFLPADQALERAELVVCHGGQLLVFEALRQHRPVFVMPLQPEQAQNGRCLERLGCGVRLRAGTVFDGTHEDMQSWLQAHPAELLAERMTGFLSLPETKTKLLRTAQVLATYTGVQALADTLLESA